MVTGEVSRSESRLQQSVSLFLLDRDAMQCTRKTLEMYRYALGNFLKFLENEGIRQAEDISSTHIRAFLIRLRDRGLKDTTQHLHARCIKAYLNWTVREGDLAVSPMTRVTMPRVRKSLLPPLTLEEVKRLLAECDRRTAVGARNYAMLLTLLDTGLRASELVQLNVGDIDARTGVCTLIGKGRKQRVVRVGRTGRSAILRMLQLRQNSSPEAPLWVGYDIQGREDGPLSVHGLQTMIRRTARKAGMENCGPHRFRRTFAVWCLRDGMDLRSLQLLMGHSSLAVLQRYLSLDTADLERAHAMHSPVDKGLVSIRQ